MVFAQSVGAARIQYAKAVQLSGSISDEDYPPEAIRANAEGTAVASFDIAVSGRVTACRITQSSGSQVLDDRTCEIIMQRFVYQPARAGRQIVPETKVQRVRWAMPGGKTLPVAPSGPYGVTLAFDSDETGAIERCTVLEQKWAYPSQVDPCANAKVPTGRFVDKNGQPAKVRVIVRNSVEAQLR